MSTIQAIETTYAGCRFRSRLEARWAVFFDTIGWEWQYEPEGFERSWGWGETETVVRYLPDFYLPTTETWVEVKGSREALVADWQKMAVMVDWGGALPHVEGSYYEIVRGRYPTKVHGLLVLGPIPRTDVNKAPTHGLLTHGKGMWTSPVTLRPGRPIVDAFSDCWGRGEPWYYDASWNDHADPEEVPPLTEHWAEHRLMAPLTMRAYDAARQARFGT